MWFLVGLLTGTALGICVMALLRIAGMEKDEAPLCEHFNDSWDCDECEAKHAKP